MDNTEKITFLDIAIEILQTWLANVTKESDKIKIIAVIRLICMYQDSIN